MANEIFDESIPADTEGVKQGALRIRSMRQTLNLLLKTFFSDAAGTLKANSVSSAMITALDGAKLNDGSAPITKLAPSVAKYIPRTKADGTAAEWVNTNAFLQDGDVALSKLAAGAASANDTVRLTGGVWTNITLGALLTASATAYFPGTFMSNATKFVETGVLASKPTLYKAVFRCTGAELGYAVGDEVEYNDMLGDQTSFQFQAATLIWDSTNSKLRLWWEAGSAGIRLQQRGTSGHSPINQGNWAPKIYYWL